MYIPYWLIVGNVIQSWCCILATHPGRLASTIMRKSAWTGTSNPPPLARVPLCLARPAGTRRLPSGKSSWESSASDLRMMVTCVEALSASSITATRPSTAARTRGESRKRSWPSITWGTTVNWSTVVSRCSCTYLSPRCEKHSYGRDAQYVQQNKFKFRAFNSTTKQIRKRRKKKHTHRAYVLSWGLDQLQ